METRLTITFRNTIYDCQLERLWFSILIYSFKRDLMARSWFTIRCQVRPAILDVYAPRKKNRWSSSNKLVTSNLFLCRSQAAESWPRAACSAYQTRSCRFTGWAATVASRCWYTAPRRSATAATRAGRSSHCRCAGCRKAVATSRSSSGATITTVTVRRMRPLVSARDSLPSLVCRRLPPTFGS